MDPKSRAYPGPWYARIAGILALVLGTQVHLVAVKPLAHMIIFALAFGYLGKFSAKVGPRTPLNGSGSETGAERT